MRKTIITVNCYKNGFLESSRKVEVSREQGFYGQLEIKLNAGKLVSMAGVPRETLKVEEVKSGHRDETGAK